MWNAGADDGQRNVHLHQCGRICDHKREVSSSTSSTDSSEVAPIVIGGFDVDEGDTLDLSS